jgi:DNA-binding response OmpR family regulator
VAHFNFIRPMKDKVIVFFANAPPSVREMLNRILQSENYEALWAANDREALELLQNEHPDLLLLDFNRPLKRALNTLEQLQAVNALVPVILIAEQRAEFAHAEAGRVAALIRKPFAVSLLLQTMRDVLNPLPEAARPDALEQHAHSPSQ